MAVTTGWFIANYKRRAGTTRPSRYCAMDDYTTLIFADGGNWAESEVLGNCAVVKVKADSTTLATIAADADINRIPLVTLDDSLSTLTSAQRTAIKNRVLATGYSLAEVNAALPDLSVVTLRDVVRFLTTRRQMPRYDSATDTIICDGMVQPCRPLEHVDAAVK